MQPSIKNIAFVAMMGAPYQIVYANDYINNDVDDETTKIHLDYETRCSSYGTDNSICDRNFRFDVISAPSPFTFRVKGDTFDNPLDSAPSTLSELSLGFQNSWFKIDGGLLEINSPVIDHLYKPGQSFMTPLALGEGLIRHKNFGDQVGARIQLDLPISSRWSFQLNASKTRTHHDEISHEVTEEQNTDRLLRYNSIDLNSMEQNLRESFSTLESQLDINSISDIQTLFDEGLDASHSTLGDNARRQVEALALYSWTYLTHSNGRARLHRYIDKKKIVQTVNQFRQNYIDEVNGISVSDNLEQNLLNALGDYVDESDISLAVATLRSIVPDIKEDLLDIAGEPLTEQQITDFIDQKLDDLIHSIENDMRSNARNYHDLLKGNLDEIALIHKQYQKELLYAHMGFSYSNEPYNIQFGISAYEMTSNSDELLTETGAEIYGIFGVQLTDKLLSESVISINGKENSLGIDGYYSGYLLIHQRFQYQFNQNTRGYVSFGGSGQERDGQVIALGGGVQHCRLNGQLCLSASYEKTESKDYITNKYTEFGLDSLRGESWRLGISYNY